MGLARWPGRVFQHMHVPFPMRACMQLYAAQLLRGTQPRLAVNLPRPTRAPSATSRSPPPQSTQGPGPRPAQPQATPAPAMQEWHLTDERFIAPSLTGREDAVAGMARAAASQVRCGGLGAPWGRLGGGGVVLRWLPHCCDQAICYRSARLDTCRGGSGGGGAPSAPVTRPEPRLDTVRV